MRRSAGDRHEETGRILAGLLMIARLWLAPPAADAQAASGSCRCCGCNAAGLTYGVNAITTDGGSTFCDPAGPGTAILDAVMCQNYCTGVNLCEASKSTSTVRKT